MSGMAYLHSMLEIPVLCHHDIILAYLVSTSPMIWS